MTDALKAIVEAMFAEVARQVDLQKHRSATVSAVLFDKPEYQGVPNPNTSVAHISGDIDLEKVARAGLEAIRDHEAMDVTGLHLPPGYQPGSHSARDIWISKVDAILKDTP